MGQEQASHTANSASCGVFQLPLLAEIESLTDGMADRHGKVFRPIPLLFIGHFTQTSAAHWPVPVQRPPPRSPAT